MSQLNERGADSERNSALWGTGGRGGDRSSVLWGKGGRSVLVATMVVALAAPLAATASKGKPVAPVVPPASGVTAPTTPSSDPAPPSGSKSNSPDGKSWVAKGLLDKAKSNPNDRVSVIITSAGGTATADLAVKWLAKLAAKSNQQSDFQGTDQKSLNLVGGVALTLPAHWVQKLEQVPGLLVTPDATVKVSGSVSSNVSGSSVSSSQLWPYESGNASLWAGDTTTYAGKAPAIAIVDSGIQNRADFGNRIVASVNLSTLSGNTSADDQRGHGTFVAGIAAGASADLTGAAPGAPLVSIKVMDSTGTAKTSDIINACQWILDNKATYNIRVANFSLHSSYATNFYRDPLDQAVEKLWFGGVVVVAAAGNYGISNTQASGVKYSPGNDPFVITVGAIDLGNSMRANDDQAAPWSAWGYTNDGFYKPEISAPGRYMVGPVPAGSSLTLAKPGNMVGSDRIQLSGTSFAAPVVSGTVADMLARHPDWTPDQVKGALMQTARAVHIGNPKSAGLGEVTATRAVTSRVTPNPNRGLDQFVSAAADGSQSFNAMSWASAAQASMSWNSMSWSDQSWSDQSWSDQAWGAMSWADMSWSDMSWADMSWSDMSWSDVSSEDAAEGDNLSGTDGYVAPTDVALAASTDPDVAVPVDGVDPAAALGLVPTAAAPATPVVDPTTTTTTDPTTTTVTDPTATTLTVTDPTATTPTATTPLP
jgi:serine protease AprX